MAMLCAAAVTAQFVAGKAARDALFLTSLHVTDLPTMLMVTSIVSILLVIAYGRIAGRIAPALLVPAAFVASGGLFLGEWALRATFPSTTAVLVYLHVSGIGPVLASGVWLITSERFDPRTAKRRFGQIAGAGTLGGLLGAIASERVAALAGVPAMLLFLGAFQFISAWLVWLLARADGAIGSRVADASPQLGSGLRVVVEAPHLRHMALLVLLGTTGAALLEYLFKAAALETLGPGDNLLRFFALYYAAISLITFVLQTVWSRTVLDRFGLAMTAGTPSIALLAGSIGSLLAPGFAGLAVGRAGEAIFRGSWFRSGYELFYTPLPPREKRVAKSIIDVAFDRLGDAVGGGLVRLVIVFLPAVATPTILWLAVATSIAAIIVASSLNRWYLRTLETSLLAQRRGLNLSETRHDSIHTMEVGAETDTETQSEMQDILWLRSRSRARIIEVLSRQDGPSPALLPHVIPLLAWDPVADYALFALRAIAEDRVGELIDFLLDPKQPSVIRRRLARVFSVCTSQRAAEGLMLALDDPRFEVRFQSARSLAAIVVRNPGLSISRERIYGVVLREVAVERPVWESRRLLDGVAGDSPLDEFIRDRAGQSLAHVFTLLSMVLPRDPLRVAFKGLNSEDRQLRGTALEYLQELLPPEIRAGLWPFLVGRRRVKEAPQPNKESIKDLLRASASITLQGAANRL
jgi:hypothetical protein